MIRSRSATSRIARGVARVRFLVFRALFRATPDTNAYALKRWLLRMAGIEIGPGTMVHARAVFHTPYLKVGRGVWIGSDVHVYGNPEAVVDLGDGCSIGPHVVFMTGSHAIGPSRRRAGPGFVAPIVVGAGCGIGVRSVLMPGASLGPGCIVAAGSVVTRSFGPDLMISGSPARVSRRMAQEDGTQLSPSDHVTQPPASP